MCWIKQRGLEGIGWRKHDPDAPRGGGELSLKGLKGGDLGKRGRHCRGRHRGSLCKGKLSALGMGLRQGKGRGRNSHRKAPVGLLSRELSSTPPDFTCQPVTLLPEP